MIKIDIFKKKNHKYLIFFTINQYYEDIYRGINVNFDEKDYKNTLNVIRMLKIYLKLNFLLKNEHF